MPDYTSQHGKFIVASKAQAGIMGVEMKINFVENAPVPNSVVALIQAVKCTSGNSLANLTDDFPTGGAGDRVDALWTADRWAIDADGAKRKCPAFGLEFPPHANLNVPWDF